MLEIILTVFCVVSSFVIIVWGATAIIVLIDMIKSIIKDSKEDENA